MIGITFWISEYSAKNGLIASKGDDKQAVREATPQYSNPDKR